MNKLSKQKRDQLILTAVGTVMVCGALWYLVILSFQAKLTGLAKQSKELAEKIGKAEAELKKAPQIEENYGSASNLLWQIEEPMPSGDMYTWIINTINNFTTPYKDISIPSFSREQMGEVDMLPSFAYKAATFHLKGTAHYNDFGRLVADFENHFPFFLVQNIELIPTRQAGGEEAEKLDFSVEVVALVRPSGP